MKDFRGEFLEKCDPAKIWKAIRKDVNYRYDLLIPEFLAGMAEVAHIGAVEYGDHNYKRSKLEGNRSPINHIYAHLNSYQRGIFHDKLQNLEGHLLAIAFNAMMEYFYCTKTWHHNENATVENVQPANVESGFKIGDTREFSEEDDI